MSREARGFLTAVTILIFAIIGTIIDCESGCSKPGPTKVRPLYTSCKAAEMAGVPRPIVIGDPGWNPRLDYDRDGVIC